MNLALLITTFMLLRFTPLTVQQKFVSYAADPLKVKVRTYYKNDAGQAIKNLSALGLVVAAKHERLLFAMNGGMYMEANVPLGLYVENGKIIHPLNTAKASGNFYLKPNGVFYISKFNRAGICKTEDYRKLKDVAYATQSGPMLLVDGDVNPIFTKGSANVYVRNGVGVLADGKLLFVKSNVPVNFYDFAAYFKEQGCTQALYLDGFVSKVWYPEKNIRETEGNFGAIIGASIPENDMKH